MVDEDDQAPQEEQGQAPQRAPWTIKGVSRETRDLVLEAAARRGEPVAAWLDRAARSPAIPSPAPTLDAAAVASLLQTYVALAAVAEVQPDKGLVEDYAAFLCDLMRRMREAFPGPT